MTTKTSLHKCGSWTATYADTVKRNRSVFIFGIVLMMSAPLGAVLNITTEHNGGLLAFFMVLTVVVPMALSILIPIIVFRYLHSKKAIDTYHSLPVKRTTLFLGKFLAGLTVALVPALLGYGLAFAIGFLDDPTPTLNAYSDFSNTICTVAPRIIPSVVTVYVFVVFVLISCGTLWEALMYGTAMTFSIAGICYSIPSLVEQLYGFGGSSGLSEWLISFTPFYFLFSDTRDYRLVFSIVVTIGLIMISLFLYQNRKSENTGSSFSFRFMFHIVSVFISLCLIFILYSLNHELISSLILGFLAYFIMSVIANRGFKRLLPVFLRTAGIVVFSAGFIIAFEATGGFGYEMRLPDPEKIESVYLRPIDVGDYGTYTDYSQARFYDPMPYAKAVSRRIFSKEENTLKGYTSAENIKMVHQLHKNILQEKDKFILDRQVTIDIEYRLKNGNIIRRNYTNISKADFAQLIAINRSEEYLMLKYPFLKDGYHYNTSAKVYHVNALSAENATDVFEAWTIAADEVAQALKKDILSRPSGFETAPTSEYVGQILLSEKGISDNQYSAKQKNLTDEVLVKIYECDRNVLTLLENRGFLSILRRTKAEYNSDIYLYPSGGNTNGYEYCYRVSGIEGYLYEKDDQTYYKITDADDRAFLLKQLQPVYYSEVDCDVITMADSSYYSFLVPNISQTKIEEILSRAEIVNGYLY
ncbi:MAG: hypothetical protein PUB00_09285 [Clostridiales bacterium]|nr:hypothetical protein [Clostridiales bacterium]